MQFPESWLREFCDPPLTTRELADVLTMGGLEVEDLRFPAPAFTGVVVGQIRSTARHPNADRLQVCEVDIGQRECLTVVCGAPNARTGLRVACATVGARLPSQQPGGEEVEIGVGRVRGVESRGMLCSARELGLSDDSAGLLELDDDAAIGANVRSVLSLDDTIFVLKLTPNLAHALGVYGIARELSALTGAPLKCRRIAPIAPRSDHRLKVTISASDLCGRFSGRVIRDVDVSVTTPRWMTDRLARCGQRSVSVLVDISNYVMFELGRPSHIFDLDKIHGGLDVRWGRDGEQLRLLNGTTIEVDASVGVIADDVQVESLAGIMGGDATAVSEATRNIYLEAAFWWPQAIQGRSRRFNFSTDAGHRFERGVDPSTTVEHIEYITRLILDICGGEPGPMDDQVTALPARDPIMLRVSRASRVIGMPLTTQQCLDAFSRLGLTAQALGDQITVVPPAHRFDLALEEDLIEEVARIIGFDRLPSSPPLAVAAIRSPHERRRSRFALRRQLAQLGYQETINFSFVDEAWERDLAGNTEPIRLLNPIASHMSVMRSSLLASLLHVLRFNVDRKADRVRVFELGRVFRRDASVAATDRTVKGVHQPMRLAGLAYGHPEGLQWSGRVSSLDFFDVKGDVELLVAPRNLEFKAAEHPALHPGRCASISLEGQTVGVLGELHPRWRQQWGLAQAPMLFELELDAVLDKPLPMFETVPRFQPVERDIAVVLSNSVTYAMLASAVWKADTEGLLKSAVLFDLYRPKSTEAGIAEGQKSMALRLTLSSGEATLTEARIEEVVGRVVESITSSLGGRLRG